MFQPKFAGSEKDSHYPVAAICVQTDSPAAADGLVVRMRGKDKYVHASIVSATGALMPLRLTEPRKPSGLGEAQRPRFYP